MKRIVYLSLLFIGLTACGPEAPAPVNEVPVDPPSAPAVRAPEEIPPVIIDTAPLVDESAEEIEAIRREYATVEADFKAGKLKMDSIEYECPNEPAGGRINLYRDGDNIRLIRHSYYAGDHYGATASYYFKNNAAFFAYLQEGSWVFDGEPNPDGTPNTRDDIREFRTYFNAEEIPIRCLSKSYVIRSSDHLQTDPDRIRNDRINCEASNISLEWVRRFLSQLTVAEMKGFACGAGQDFVLN